jgi:two-component system sensor histidine kinase KdpD
MGINSNISFNKIIPQSESYLKKDKINISPETEKFLDLVRKSRKGSFKIYIGLAAGVGKTYKMLQEAQQMVNNGVDAVIGYIETHGRKETEKLLAGLPQIPRKKIYYKGKEFEEMDIDSILLSNPEVVIVDELAHSNVPGSRNEKRYQDVEEVLFNGISVISALNIQHIESLNNLVEEITKIKVSETIPDKIIGLADEVVNIDLTADELIQRLREGKIYKAEKIQTALKNFFKREHLLQLRELALREVANAVERKIDTEVTTFDKAKDEIILVCLGLDPEKNKKIIRRSSRMAERFDSKWYVLYVDTAVNSFEKLDLKLQRHLINNFKMATELGAMSEKIFSDDIIDGILEFAKEKNVTKIILGKPTKQNYFKKLFSLNLIDKLLDKIENEEQDYDLEIIA